MPEIQGINAAERPNARLQAPVELPYPAGDDSWHILEPAASKAAPCGDVVLLGRDTTLQRTRASLLERVGFRCHLAQGADEILCMAHNHFDVIVVCHTLPVTEACSAIGHVQFRFPKAVVLRLARYLQAEEECFEHLLVFPTPSQFVAMVQRLSLTPGCIA